MSRALDILARVIWYGIAIYQPRQLLHLLATASVLVWAARRA